MTAALAYERVRPAFALFLAAQALALGLFVAAPHANEYPAAALGIEAFIAAQLLLPACRLRFDVPLCPANVAQIFFWMQLVLVPLLIGYLDIAQGTLPHVPSSEAIGWACGLRVVGYLSFCVVFQILSARRKLERQVERSSGGRHELLAERLFVIPAAAVGLLGFFLMFGSVGTYLEYISSPVLQREMEQLPTSLASAGGTFLRPFLGFALVVAWSVWLTGRPRQVFAAAGVTLALLAVLVLANFNYNRGTMLAPVVAAAAAYSLHVRRISFTTAMACGVAVLAASLAWGWYRSTEQRITDLATADLHDSWSSAQINDFLQIYGSGPQLTGFLLEELDAAQVRYLGKTLVPSLLYPLPILGKPFRPNSGITIFNMMIYQDPEIMDQNIPYDGELFMNLHIPGIVVGYALLGALLVFLQRRFLASVTPAQAYLWFFPALWAVFPGSLPVLSQIAIYFMWPLYALLVLHAVLPFATHAKAEVSS